MSARPRHRAPRCPRWCCASAARLLGLAALVISSSACPPPRPVPTDLDSGWSTEPDPQAPPPAAPRQAMLPTAQRQRWPQAAQISELTLLPGSGPSEHLGGGSFRQVLINAAAADYARPASAVPLPVGAIIVQRQLGPPPESAVLGYFTMHKQATQGRPPHWQYQVLDSQLRVVSAAPPASCVRCHQEAPTDGWFGPPLSAAPTSTDSSAQKPRKKFQVSH